MKISKAGMEIEYDLDCMDADTMKSMEHLNEVLHQHGWTMWASGADVGHARGEDGTRTRDMALRFCKDMECEYWDGNSGCDAPKTRCINLHAWRYVCL